MVVIFHCGRTISIMLAWILFSHQPLDCQEDWRPLIHRLTTYRKCLVNLLLVSQIRLEETVAVTHYRVLSLVSLHYASSMLMYICWSKGNYCLKYLILYHVMIPLLVLALILFFYSGQHNWNCSRALEEDWYKPWPWMNFMQNWMLTKQIVGLVNIVSATLQ